MKSTTRAIVMCGLLLAAVPSAQAVTYHVAPVSGKDSHSCTEAQTTDTPKQTLASVFDCLGTAEGAGAGHTVRVTEAGTFTEALINNIPGGTDGAPFTFRNDSGGTVTIRPTASGAGVIFLKTIATRHIVIDGFAIDAIHRHGNTIYVGAGPSTDSFVTIKNTSVTNGGLGSQTNGSGAIILAGNRNTLDNLEIWNSGNAKNLDHGIYIASAHNIVRNSRVWDSCARGIKIDSNSTPIVSDHNLVMHNAVWGSGHSTHGTTTCTQGRSGMLVRGHKNTVTRNVIRHNVDEGIRLFGKTTDTEDTYVYNNTIVNNGKHCLTVEGGTRHVIKNNICLGNGTDTLHFKEGASALHSHNHTTGILRALFTRPGVHDYTLKASSKAIDGGTAKLCTGADQAAEKCHRVLVLSGFAGVHPDQGAVEVGTPHPSLVAHYGFDTVATDAGRRGNHCAASADMTYTSTAGQYVEGTHAAVFDAPTDHLTCPHVGLSDPATFTIKAYAHATTLSGKQYIWAHHTENPKGQRIYAYTDDTQLRFGLGSQSSFPIMTLTTGRYYQIVMVVETGQWKAYADGELITSVPVADLTSLTGTLCVGNWCGASKTEGWAGYIDAVQVYNTAWTQADVTADCDLYCAAPPGPP